MPPPRTPLVGWGVPRSGPQTPIEYWQNRQHHPRPFNQIFVPRDIWNGISSLERHEQYQVYHKWKKVWGRDSPNIKYIPSPHHSQIFIFEAGDTPAWDNTLVSFGVGRLRKNIPERHGTAVLVSEWDLNRHNKYQVSDSYEPNPIVVEGKKIQISFWKTVAMCGSRYYFLTNNCQKFARLFMQLCGAQHKRHFFHP